ncbi:MAG: hypothetical protein WBW61_09355 [Rhodanobacteraceae bacterium]
MKILTMSVASALALSAVASTYAADAKKPVVSRDYTDTVMPADQQSYEAGAKAYNQCLREHGSKHTWTAWVHETGDVYQYSYVAGPYTWADFDTMHSIGKACDATWRSQANPHLKGEISVFMVDQPEMSHMPRDWDKQAPPALIEVDYFTLNAGHDADEAFTAGVKKIAAAATKSNWPYYNRTLQVQYGGEGAPDYIMVFPGKSWADLGAEPDPGLWKMVEGVYGKADAAALRKSLNDAIKNVSSHVDSYNADLSYIAGK